MELACALHRLIFFVEKNISVPLSSGQYPEDFLLVFFWMCTYNNFYTKFIEKKKTNL